MECRKVSSAAVAEEDEGRRCVLEAAEALAGMAHCSAARGGASSSVELRQQHAVVISQDQPAAAESATVAGREKVDKIAENTSTQLCSTSYTSNPLMKFKRKLTEAEKEERKICRVMANRESARQTIRRRQAMHLELTRKADDVLEENENLKKQKELMLEQYNSLKGRNAFLKEKLADAKKAAAREAEEERNPSEAERFCSATASNHAFQNQPSMFPCLWPFIFPPSDVFPFQYGPQPHNTSSSSQFSMDPPCLHQGQSPLVVVPVPWLLPMLTHANSGRTNTHQCGKCSCSSANPSNDDGRSQPSSQNMSANGYNQIETVCGDGDENGAGTSGGECSVRQTPSTMVVPGVFSPVRRETIEAAPRSCEVDDSADLRLVSALRHQEKQQIVCSPPKKGEEVFVATEARRRRKELMKLKNIHCK